MASDPPTLFSENNVALFATKFFGVQRPHPFSLPKKRNEIFRIGNDPPPLPSEVFRKFIKFGTAIRPLPAFMNLTAVCEH